MEIERIALFYLTQTRYGVLNAFLDQLSIPLAERFRLLPIHQGRGNYQKMSQDWVEFAPQMALIFNGLFLSSQGGGLLGDRLQLPTLHWLVDAPYHFHLAASPWRWVALIDRRHCDYMRRYLPPERVWFLPHAVDERKACPPDQSARPWECAMFSSAIDCDALLDSEKLAKQWGAELAPLLREWMVEVTELYLANYSLSLWQAFDIIVSEEERERWHYQLQGMLHAIDLYAKGRARLELLKSVAPWPVQLFGGGDSWPKLLEGAAFAHVSYQGEVEFDQIPQLMEQCKVVLSSCCVIREGGHERVFNALLSGAAVYCEKSGYLQERFSDNKGILVAPEREQLELLLTNEAARSAAVTRGQDQVYASELWSHRVEALCTYLSEPLTL